MCRFILRHDTLQVSFPPSVTLCWLNVWKGRGYGVTRWRNSVIPFNDVPLSLFCIPFPPDGGEIRFSGETSKIKSIAAVLNSENILFT